MTDMNTTNWDNTNWNITNGMDVVGADDDKVGDVAEVQPNYIVVSKGFFFPTDYYIPMSAVTSVTDKVYLNVTKDEALNQGWDVVPEYDTTAYGTDQATAGQGTYAAQGTYDESNEEQPFEHRGEPGYAHRDDSETVEVALTEEELAAHKQQVERGEAHIDKVVTEEEQTIDVPVTEERLTVRRRAAEGDEQFQDDTAFQDGTITVPLRGEEVVVDKQAKTREVLEVGKEKVTGTQRVTDTVRREEAQIRDDAGNLVDEVQEETAGRRRR